MYRFLHQKLMICSLKTFARYSSWKSKKATLGIVASEVDFKFRSRIYAFTQLQHH